MHARVLVCVCTCIYAGKGKGLCVRACTHVKCVVCTFESMCIGADPCKKKKKKKGCVPQAIPPSSCSPLVPPPAPPFQQTGFWCYANLPSGHSLSAGTHPVLLTCPRVLPFFLVLFPYTSWPSLPLSHLLSHTPSFSSRSLSLSVSPQPRHVSSPAGLSWLGLLPPHTVCVCVCVCVCTCARTSTCAFYSLCLHCVCCKGRTGGLLIC